MKIALIGEFSGLHNNLKSGLIQLGHEVVLYAAGDGFKQLSYDQPWGPNAAGYYELAKYLLIQQPRKLQRILDEFDVVQIINPNTILSPNTGRSIYANPISAILGDSRAVISLVVAGCDSYVQKTFSEQLPNICRGCLNDESRTSCAYEAPSRNRFNRIIAEKADVIVPFLGKAYLEAYGSFNEKVLGALMLPLDTKSVAYKANTRRGKLRILHGINRPGFKGSEEILHAMHELQSRYPDRIELLIPDRLPFVRYMEQLNQANVVIDQLYSDGMAMNALYSMAAGKIVLTGYSPVFRQGEIDYVNAPAINIASGEDAIINNITDILSWTDEQLGAQGQTARAFVEEKCNPVTIAGILTTHWQNIRQKK